MSEEPSSTILMIVGELKSIAAQLTNAVDDIREHRNQYKEDQKSVNQRIDDVEERIHDVEKLWEHHLGKMAGIAISAAILAALITWFFECHMGSVCK